ncbi:MAG: preprotein translocase subunit YajC [Propionibacteriaceae bacterium]|jgi:preprotein translocase subunit YajC|nr:preprotein translocase subunit YajC [Propionibacteriaceae bacterium]
MDFMTIGLLVVAAAALYFLMIRPQKKRQEEQKKAMDALGPGDRVMTIGGILATVVQVGEKQMVIEIAPGVEITVLKQAISQQKVEDEFEYVDADSSEHEDTTFGETVFDPTNPETSAENETDTTEDKDKE